MIKILTNVLQLRPVVHFHKYSEGCPGQLDGPCWVNKIIVDGRRSKEDGFTILISIQ